jgi:hypothetical protein
VDEQKKRVIDLYVSDNLSEEAYINENIALDKELHRLKSKKAEFISKLPPIHKDSIDLSIRHFCDTARVRVGTCFNFETKRQFLLDYVQRIIYRQYKVTVIGSVPIWMNTNEDRQLSETRKMEFRLEGEIDTSTLHRKPRKKFADDGRLRAWGSGGRKPRIEPALPQPLSAPRALARPRL